AYQNYTLPPAFYQRAANLPKNSERRFEIAKEVLFTKVIEQRARAAEVQRHFKPDLTIVLQHDASPASGRGRLAALIETSFLLAAPIRPKSCEAILMNDCAC
ncbi:MAG: hypothetical protein WBZ19_05940, partial [Chthoniobacterales bacterium]